MTPRRQLTADAARVLVAVVERLRAGADALAGEITEQITGEVAEYGRYATGDERAGFAESVRVIVDLFLDLAPVEGRLSEAQRAEVAAVGEARAREGHSLAGVTAALDLAFDVARSRVFDAFWSPHPRRPDRDALESVVATLDRFKSDVVDAYREGHGRVDVEARRDRDRARDAFLATLLAGGSPDLRWVRAQSTELDVELTAPLEVVVAVDSTLERREASDPFQSRVASLARALPAPVLGPVPVEHDGYPVGPLLCLVVPDATPLRRREARAVVAARCGELGLTPLHAQAASVPQLHPTLVRLLAATPVADRLAGRVGPVTTPEALYGHRLADAATLAEQEHELKATLGPLRAVPKTAGEHVATLRALLDEQFNRAAAGRRLGVSAEAVSNRIVRIEELTGLSLKERRDWRRVDLALCLLDLYDDLLPAAGDPWWTDHSGASTLTSLLTRG